MDFKISPQLEDLRQRTRAFVDEHVIPLESDVANYDEYENIRLDVLEGRARQGAARRACGRRNRRRNSAAWNCRSRPGR